MINSSQTAQSQEIEPLFHYNNNIIGDDLMPYTTDTVTNEAPAMICPVCGKGFHDIHGFAVHMNEHSQDEKKRKAEEEKKEREAQRKKDIDNLLMLKAEQNAAEKKLKNALNEYEKKYGLVFPYINNDVNDSLKDLIRFLGW